MVNIDIVARGVGAVLGVVATTVFAACGATDQPAAQGQLTTKDIQGVGKVLVDQTGRTLFFTWQAAVVQGGRPGGGGY